MKASRSRRRLHRLSLAACLALGLAGTPLGWALPQGALPTAGSVTVRADGATRLEIVQTTARAALDWTSFSIAAGERVRIRQPDAAAVLFNRVTGADPSLILGQLQADGRVFLSNPRGVIFGAGSRVDVGSLVATTLNVDTTQLANGRWQLSGGTAGTGELRADGEINAPNGTVALVSPRVSIGGNVLAGRLGVAAVGAVQVDVDGDGLIFFNARSEDLTTRLDLLGSATALAGSAELRAAARAGFADTVLNLEGTVRARGLALRDGQVVIDGGSAGLTRVAGEVSAQADAAGTHGGAITVLGEQIQLAGTARLDASGTAAGGSVRVGGDYQGSNAVALPHARSVDVSAGAALQADATQQGDGGRVIVWSDERTQFAGAASVRGGASGGDGGLVEVSSRGALNFTGDADRRAPQGRAGTLLLDPATLTIQTAAGDNALAVATLLTNLAAGDVTLLADTTITVNAAISSATTATSATSGSLTLRAGNVGSPSIVVNQAIAINGTGKTLTLDAPAITIADVNLSAAGLVLNGAASWVNAAARTVSTSISGTGSLTKLGAGTLTLSGSNSHGGGTTVSAGTLAVGAAGALPTGKAVTVAGGSALDLAGFSPSAGVLTLTDGSLIDSGVTAGSLSATQFALSKGTVSAALAGDGATLTKSGTDVVTLSGTNTYGGLTTVSGGTLKLGADGALPAGKLVTVEGGGTLDLASFKPSVGVFTLTDGSVIDSGGTAGSLSATQFALSKGTVSAVLAGASATLTKSGSDTVTLSGANTYGGGTTVSAGALQAGVATVASATPGVLASGPFGIGTVTVAAGASVDLAGFAVNNAWLLAGSGLNDLGALRNSSTATAGSSSGAITLDGDVALGAASGATLSLAGAISDKSGAATPATLIQVDSGTLALGAAGVLATARPLELRAGSFDLRNQSAAVSSFTLAGGRVIDSTPAVAPAPLATLSVSGAITLQSGQVDVPLAGAANLSKTGSGSVSLNASPTITGTLSVDEGTLALGPAASLPSGVALTVSGGTLDLGGGSSTVGSFTLDGGSVTHGVLNGSGSAFDLRAGSVSAQLGGTASLRKTAASGQPDGGSVTLSGANSYSGGTTLSAGTLLLDANDALPAGQALTVNGGTLDLGGRTASVSSFTLSGGSVVSGQLSGTGTDFDLRAGTVSARLDGAVGLRKTAASGQPDGGTVTLSGSNGYSGGTTVSAGTLLLGAGGALPVGQALTVNAGTLDLGGSSATVSTFTLNGGSVANGQLSGSGAAFDLRAGTVSAQLRGGTSLRKTAASGQVDGGTVLLSGNNDYSGGTELSGGTLELGASAALPASEAVLVNGNAQLDLAGKSPSVGVFTLSDGRVIDSGATPGALTATRFSLQQGSVAAVLAGSSAALDKTGSGSVTLSGANTYGGGTTVTGGSLVAGAASDGTPGALVSGPFGTTAVTVVPGGSVDLAGFAVDNTWILSGSGTGNIGALRNSAATAASSRGLVGLDADAAIGVASGGTFTLSGELRESTLLTNLSKLGAGQLILTAQALLTGTTTVSAGTLQLGNGNTAGGLSGPVEVQAGARLEFHRNADIVVDSLISGAGELRQSGSGTLTLIADNSLSGTTTIASGSQLNLGAFGSSGSVAGNIDNQGTLSVRRSDTLTLAGTLGGAGALDIAGGDLRLNGARSATGATTVAAGSTLIVDRGVDLRWAGDVGGAGQVEKRGSGTLSLLGDWSPGAGTQVTGGTLQVGEGTGIGSLAGGAITLQNGAALVFRRSGSLVLASDVSGTGSFEQAGPGTLVLTGTVAASIDSTVSAGTLRLGQAGGSGWLNGALRNDGTLVFDRSDAALAMAGDISGSGSLVKAGTGTLALGGSNTYAGGTQVNAGTLIAGRDSVGSAGALTAGPFGTGAVSVASGAAIDLAGRQVDNAWSLAGARALGNSLGTASSAGAVTLASASTIRVAGDQLKLSGAIGGAGALTVQGPGTLRLDGNSTASGGTSVASGALQINGGVDRAGSGALQVAIGATLDLRGGARLSVPISLAGTLLNSAGTGAVSGALTLTGPATLQVDGAGLTVSGAVAESGGAQALTKAGTGTLTLSGVNTATGGLAVLAGSVVAAGGQALGDAGTLQLDAGSSLRLLADEAVGALSGAGTVELSSFTLGAGADGASTSFSGLLQGSGGLAKQGAGIFTLTGANTYTGATEVQAGRLVLGAGGTAGLLSAVSVAAGAQLTLQASQVFGSLAGAGNVALGVFSLSAGGNDGSTRFDGVMSGSGSFSKAGAGTLTLGGRSNYSGGTAVQAGRVVAAADSSGTPGSLSAGPLGTAMVSVASGAAVDLAGHRVDNAWLLAGSTALANSSGSASSAGAVILGAATTVAVTGTQLSLSGTLSGTAPLTVQGLGTLRLSGDSTASGGTTVSSGTLQLSGGVNRAGTAAVQVASGATLDLRDGALLSVPLTLAGTLANSAGAGTLSGALNLSGNATLQVAGDGLLLSGAVADVGVARTLSKTGAGTLTLSGFNASQGGLSVLAGTVVATGGLALGDVGSLQLAAGSTLRLQADEAVGALAGAGTVALDRFTLSAGADGVSTSFSGVAQGSGGLAKQGGGTLTLSGANTYTGATQVQAGTLVLGAGGRAGVASAVTVAPSAQLTLQANQVLGSLSGAGTVALGSFALNTGGDGRSTQFDGLVSGSGNLLKAGAGTLTLTGRNTYAGGTQVNAGTLIAGRDSEGAAGALTAGPFGTGVVNVASGAAVDLAGHQVDNAWTLAGSTALGNSLGTAASAGTLTLASASTISVTGAQLNLSGAVGGTGALTVQGPGTLRLSGDSTASGGTAVSSGTLQISGGIDRTGSGALQVASGATLDLRDGAQLGVPLSLAGTLLNGAGTASVSGALTLTGDATLQVAGDGLTLSGTIADSGGARSLSKTGAGTLTLSGVNGSVGGLSVLAGSVVAAGGQALGDAGTLQLAAGSTLRLQASDTVGALSGAGTVALAGFTLAAGADGSSTSFSGALQGSGGLTKQGTGTFTLSGASPYTGATQVQAGTLVLGPEASAGVLSALSVSAGAQLTLQSSQVFGSIEGAGRVALGSFALTAGGNGSSTRFDGSLTGSGSLSKAGDGTLTLAGRSTYSGGTSVLAGQVTAARTSEGPAGALTAGPLGTGTVTVASGAAVDLAGQQVDNAWVLAGATALGSSTGSASSAGAVTLAADTGIQVGGTQLSLSGSISGPGALTLQGPGTLRLTSDSSASGGTTVASGTLQIVGGIDRAGSGPVQVASGATLDLRDGAQLSAPMTLAGTLANGSGVASANGALSLTGNATLQVDGSGLALSGAIAETGGARSLTKTGDSTLTLSGINTASGGLSVLAGTVVAAGGQALGDAGTLQLAASSTLRLQADEAVGALAGAGTVQLDRFTLSAGADGASTTFAGLLQGSGGGLAKQGSGTLTLAGANSYTGATQVQAGTLVLDAGATAGVLSAMTVAGGAQLLLQSDQVLGSLAGAGQVSQGSFALSAGGDGSSTRFDGTLSGTGSFTKAGAGMLTLGGSDARSGATLVDQGTLALASSGAGAVASAYTVNAAATLALQADVRIASLSGAGTVDLAPGSLRLGADGGSSSFSGVLQGTGGLVKQGGGSFSLTGANTYSGRTLVQGGVLEVTGDAQLGSAPAALVADQLMLDGGTLRFTAPTTLAATRGLTLQGAGGTLQLPAGVAVAVDGPLADGASVGALTVAGGGTLAFTGALDNSHSGGTRVLGSTLSVARDGQLGAADAALLLDGGTLQLRSSLRLDAARTLLLGAAGGTLDLPSGLALQFAGTIADAAGAQDGRLTVQGGGTLALDGAGANTYTGATAVRGSTLALTRDDQLGTAPLAARADQLLLDGGTLAVGAGAALALNAHRGLALGAGGGMLQVAEGASLSLAGTVADAAPGVAGALGKTGAGTLLLAGTAPNSHSGGTRVLGGTLALSRDDALGAATAALQLDGGTLQVLSGFALDALRPLQLGTAGGQIAVADGQNFSVAGSVSELAGAATLVKTGSGTLAFNGSTDHARLGPTQVLGGTLAITRDGQLGIAPTTAAPSQLLLDGATLRLDTDLTLAATRGIALGAGGGTVQVTDGVAARIDGGFSDATVTPATLRKTGAGSLTLAGDNRHGGATELQAGALATAGDERLPDAGALQMAVGTRFTLGGHETIGALADLPGVGAGLPSRLVLDRYVLTVRQAIDTQFSGRIDTGSGQLVKEGSGTLAMAGQGSGNGLFQVNSGVLVSASADLLTPDTTVQVADHATLQLDTAVTVQTLALSGELTGSGRMNVTQGTTLDGGTLRTPVSTATLTSRNSVQLLAPISVAGTAVVAGGTLTLGSAGLLQAAQLQLNAGATLATSVAGQLGSGAALALSGNSLLQLAGAETAASLTAAQGSRVAGSGRLALDGAVTLSDAAVALPVQAAQFSSRGNSELTAALTLSQSATLQGGTLVLGAGGSIESPALRLEAGLLRSTDAQALGTGNTALRIDAPATLQLGAPATVATLSLAGTVQAPAVSPAAAPLGERSIAGVSVLAADAGSALDATQSITLDGGQVTAPLATRALTATGNSTLSAAVQASDQATVAGTLTLAAGGTLATPLLNLSSGTLATSTDAQLLGTPTLRMSAGTTLQLAGSETLGALVDATPAAPGVAARVLLGERADSALRVGVAAADAGVVDSFSGVLSGAGTLVKQGTGTWVLSADQSHGDTRIEAGTLQLGDGGTGGTAGRGGIVNEGTLRVLRSDTLALDQAITGSGALEQAGSGTLVLGARGNAYAGATRVLAGTLATAGDERLPDGSAVQVAAGARLELRGNETVGSLSADGAVALGGSLSTTAGGQRFGGPVTVTSATPITLSAPGQAIEAMNDGNQWTLMPLSVRAGQLRLSAGQRETGIWRDLALGEVHLGALNAGASAAIGDRQASAATEIKALAEGDTGSLVVARRILIGQGGSATGDARLDGLLQLDAGTLTLRAMGVPDYALLAPLESGRQAVDPLQGRLLHVADDVIAQGAASRVETAAGAGLVLQAVAGGSITLGNVDNVFAGGVQALSGASWNSAWQPVALPGERAVGQSRITLAGQELVIGGQGLEADLVRLSAGRLATVDDSRIAARIWYNDSGFGIQNSAPGLVLELLPQAFAAALPFGSADAPIAANVGGKSLGDRADGLAAGYVQLLPRKAPLGSTVVFLAGPKAGESGYSFFNDGAGDQSQLPLFYNGVLPATPQLSGSLSAVASVSENARRERFEETVRTENVAIRLRAGVIAEVGPGRPATGGAEGLRVPQSCSAEIGRLDCPPAATPAPVAPAAAPAPGARP